MVFLCLLGIIGALVLGFGWVTRDRDGRRTRSALRRRYLERSTLSTKAAELEMMQSLRLIQLEYPARSGVWHLKRLIAGMPR